MNGSEFEKLDVEEISQEMADGEADPGGQNVENDALGWATEEKVEACSVGSCH
jgi:hypothetical protein